MRTLSLNDLEAVTARLGETSPMSVEAPKTAENGQKAQLLARVEQCVCAIEQKVKDTGELIAADRDRWLKITAGWYRSLGRDGLDLYLRFSALWEHADPREDRQKYMEMERYPKDEGGATIGSFFQFCREHEIGIPAEETSSGISGGASGGWRSSIFNVTEDIARPEPLVNCGGVMVVSRQNIAVITGKPKACKTTFQSAMIAACMTGGRVLNMDAPSPLRILLADTEQSPYHLKRQCERIFRLAGRVNGDYDDMTVLNLRPYAPAQRYAYIVEAIGELRPDIVFIDGATDLITDTNDLQQSEALVSNLLTVSSQFNAGIVTVVHTNPGATEKIRGHIGSTLERKCETSILMERDGMSDRIRVKSKEARNRPFEPFWVTLTDRGDLELLTESEGPKTASDWLICMMQPEVVYKHTELIQMLAGHDIKRDNAKYAISRMCSEGRIEKRKDGYTVKLVGG